MDQPPLPEISPYINRNLFSDHFLEELLPQDESWHVDDDSLMLAMQATSNLYAGREEEWSSSNEAQLEHRLVRPALQALGHDFEVQPSLPTTEAVRRPDYALFVSGEERRRAKREHEGEIEYFDKAIAIGDAKRWDRPLDKGERGSRDKFDRLSPSWQIDYYLRMSGVKWGVLTNGRVWRLYNQETSFRLDICYEIDVPRLLAARDPEEFKYFYLFFRRQAFVADAEGLCFLDRVYHGSLEYAQAVGDDLKENVYKALRLLAEGFLRTRGNDLDPARDLDEIHANSLVLLYRLLFLNYAEDRRLLPRDNRLYKESYGLVSMEREIASKVQRRDSLPALQVTYWEKLRTLLDLINQGTGALGIDAETMEVPPYNGGLFNPEKHPFLEQKKVGDKWLAQVIDLLARSQGEGVGRGFVDYSSLDVRHLGSIYEGLLEYKLRVAEQEMVAVKRRGKEQWIPATEVGSSQVLERVQPGSVYLATDRRERKATGSYYTPDYIVKYIVENTVGPLIEHRMQEDDPIDGILSLKVLDPAMGSGHFLVEATDRLAHALVEALGGSEGEPEEADVRWARREVVERCIHGVDLNPLAVELAKLSLWLHTVAEGKPLNFLDHHLKVGNSLIGAWVEDLGGLRTRRKGRKTKGAPPDTRQMNLFEIRLEERLPVMLNRVLEIVRRGSETLEDIKAKAAADQAIEELKAPFKAVADLWVSTYFGNEATEAEYQEALEHVGEPGQLWALPSVSRACEIADEKGFFHWELEFPEVFYEDSRARPNPGFDAVVGNPPYVDSENMVKTMPEERAFLTAVFSTASGNWDLYIPFWEQAVTVLNDRGRASLITPNKWISVGYGRALRELAGTRLYEIGDFSRLRVFEDAGIFPIVTFMSELENDMLQVRRFTKGYSLGFEQTVPCDFVQKADNWGIVLSEHLPLIQRISEKAQKLSSICTAEEAFTVAEAYELGALVHELSHDEPPYFKFVVTGTIDRYLPLWGFERAKYLKASYLSPVVDRQQLKARFDRRYAQAMGQKIIISGIRYFESFLDRDGAYLAAKSTVIVRGFSEGLQPEALLAILNSRLMTFYIKQSYGTLSMDGGINFTAPLVSELPVPRVTFTTAADTRAQSVGQAQTLYSADEQAALAGFIDACVSTEPEQADVLHDFVVCMAAQMIEMTVAKQTEAKGFSHWLADYTGLPIEEWRLKTIVKAYWEHGWGELQRALRQNRKAIQKASGRTVESRETLEAVQTEFEQSVGRLQPLLERIASTDGLIDLIVYRLYGLTEEEVAIVEESLAN